jgi:hypothetical protein
MHIHALERFLIIPVSYIFFYYLFIQQNLLFPVSVKHHKMILIPVQNTRQGNIFHQLLQRNPHALCVCIPMLSAASLMPNILTSFPCDKTPFTQILQGIAATVMPGNHAQTSRTAVHGV